MDDDDNDDECRAVGGMIGGRSRNTPGKPAPVSFCAPQIPHDPTPGRLGGKQATNRLSYGTAFWDTPL
jgi:hypothetical protein